MRRLLLVPAFALLSLLTPGLAQDTAQNAVRHAPRPVPRATAAEATSAELPIRRVVLYKNGVGYFEHRGRVTGNQDLNVRFTTAQLNDVLKSLTVVDLGGGRIGGVRYNSIAPLGQRLDTLRLALDANTSRAGFLDALRGARIEVRSTSASASGRLLTVEEVTRVEKGGTEVKSTEISLVTDSGDLRTFELTPATSVRILEGDMTREVGRYMALLASARDKDVRQMTISTAGDGEREVVVSYISEVPVWKSTYRIILPEDGGAKPLLQGWAIVDNTVGEDWRNIQLSLVAGAPQSFVEQISQPYYVRRPVVELPRTAQLTPQTHEGAEYTQVAPPASAPELRSGSTDGQPGGVIGGVVSSTGGGSGVGGGTYHVKALGGRNYNQMTEAENGSAVAAAAPAAAAPERYEQSFEAQSTGEALGDMFEYAIQQNVTVLQNQSALVPIVQAHVDAEKVTLWNAREHTPVRALWLTNSSGLTLDAGTFNIIEAGAFAGEGLLAEVRPNERRLISYAADTAVRVKSEGASETRPYTRLRAAHGILFLTRELRETRTYTVSNSDTTARSVVIEHPARTGWHFIDKELKPEETSNSYDRFRVKVAPASSAKLVVAEYFPQETTYALITADENLIGFILKSDGIQPDVESALRQLLAKKDAIAAVRRVLKERRDDVDGITREQARIRENMKALKGSAEEKALVERYVAGLNRQEDLLGALNSEIAEKELELNARESEYQQMAESMAFDQAR